MSRVCFLLAGACFAGGIAYIGMGMKAIQAESADEAWEKAAQAEPIKAE